MEYRLALIIFLLGVGAIVEVNPEKWPRTIDNERSSVSRPNDIDAGDVYQQISSKRQSSYTWNNYNSQQSTVEPIENENEELFKLLSDNSVAIDYEKLDLIGDQVISHANVSEETKRVARQVKKTRPGFFWTLFRVTFETINETRSAINRINEIIDSNILPDTTTARSHLKATTTRTTTTSKPKSTGSTINSMDAATTPATTTTTKVPFKLTRNTLQSLVRRNLQGLVRLFNIEWRDAINQSQISIKQFQNALGKSAQPFLKDNPATYE